MTKRGEIWATSWKGGRGIHTAAHAAPIKLFNPPPRILPVTPLEMHPSLILQTLWVYLLNSSSNEEKNVSGIFLLKVVFEMRDKLLFMRLSIIPSLCFYFDTRENRFSHEVWLTSTTSFPLLDVYKFRVISLNILAFEREKTRALTKSWEHHWIKT